MIATACLDACSKCDTCRYWSWDRKSGNCVLIGEGPKYTHLPGSVAGPGLCDVKVEVDKNWSPWLNGCLSPFIDGPPLKCEKYGMPIPPADTEKDCMEACCGDGTCLRAYHIHAHIQTKTLVI